MKRSLNRLRWAVLGGYTVAGLTWLGWRLTTVDGPWVLWCALFFLAELFLFTSSLAFDHVMACEPDAEPVPGPPQSLSVAVLITAYNEPVDLIEQTLRHALALRGASEVVLCDDGKRDELEALAGQLGASYLRRPDNRHYKAGNLNHALGNTRSDAVLVLDADHVAEPHLLERLVPHLTDGVAFVQSPQVYRNTDSFQHGRGGWHESTLFHHRLQRGAGALGCCVCVGTGVLFDRAALECGGGFATETVTEDIHTSLRLHALGYRSVYVHEVLGTLLAPDTAHAYATQRLRWTQGAMQVLRSDNPLWRKGLSSQQRTVYLWALGSFLQGWPTLLLVLAPAVFVLLGAAPLHADARVAVPLVVAHVVFDVALFVSLAGRDARLFAAERLRMINLPIWLRGSLLLVAPRALRFAVTPKAGSGRTPLWLTVPLVALFLVQVATVGLAAWRVVTEHPAWLSNALAGVLALWFAVAAAGALVHLARAGRGTTTATAG